MRAELIPEIAIAVLCIFGLAISSYFSLVLRSLIPSDARFIPKFCRMERSNCESILQAREASLLGVPNSDLGILFYLAVFFLSWNHDAVRFSGVILRVLSTVSVAAGLYLTGTLLFKIKAKCFFCLASHAVNLALFFLIIFFL